MYSSAAEEAKQFIDFGIDGMFCDQPDIALAVRDGNNNNKVVDPTCNCEFSDVASDGSAMNDSTLIGGLTVGVVLVASAVIFGTWTAWQSKRLESGAHNRYTRLQ